MQQNKRIFLGTKLQKQKFETHPSPTTCKCKLIHFKLYNRLDFWFESAGLGNTRRQSCQLRERDCGRHVALTPKSKLSFIYRPANVVLGWCSAVSMSNIVNDSQSTHTTSIFFLVSVKAAASQKFTPREPFNFELFSCLVFSIYYRYFLCRKIRRSRFPRSFPHLPFPRSSRRSITQQLIDWLVGMMWLEQDRPGAS